MLASPPAGNAFGRIDRSTLPSLMEAEAFGLAVVYGPVEHEAHIDRGYICRASPCRL